jgi:hypothetical protein
VNLETQDELCALFGTLIADLDGAAYTEHRNTQRVTPEHLLSRPTQTMFGSAPATRVRSYGDCCLHGGLCIKCINMHRYPGSPRSSSAQIA